MTNQRTISERRHHELEVKNSKVFKSCTTLEAFKICPLTTSNIMIVEFEGSTPLLPKPDSAHDPEPASSTPHVYNLI